MFFSFFNAKIKGNGGIFMEELIYKIHLMRKMLGKTTINEELRKQSLLCLKSYFDSLYAMLPPQKQNKMMLSEKTKKEVEEEQKKELHRIYQSKKYKYLSHTLKSILQIKNNRQFYQDLKNAIQNESDLERLLALLMYFQCLKEENDAIARIKELFPHTKDFRNYLTEFPIENWSNLNLESRVIFLKKILNDYYDFSFEDWKRHH